MQDEEAEPETTNRYLLEAHNVLPLPRSANVREERALPAGSIVLGVRSCPRPHRPALTSSTPGVPWHNHILPRHCARGAAQNADRRVRAVHAAVRG